MSIVNRKELLLLVIGDLIFLTVALWFSLLLRYLSIPKFSLFVEHLVPFLILFGIWILFFYIAGLYEKHTLIFRKSLPNNLFNIHIFNSLVAVLFFYFIPYFAITPKTNLFIYIIVSFGFLLLWRFKIFPFLRHPKKQSAVILSSGSESDDLVYEVNNNDLYGFSFVKELDLDTTNPADLVVNIADLVQQQNISIIVTNISDPKVADILPSLYKLIFSEVRFVDKSKIYEAIFDRVPLKIMDYGWFLKNVSIKNNISYDSVKRFLDIIAASALLLPSLLFYPLIWLAQKIDDGGSLFYIDERIGQKDEVFNLVKFRSMREEGGGKHSISKLGNFIRRTRIDELPQLWNVLKGDLSMIGPRPEKKSYVGFYSEQVPFYNMRHITKPGLSGWAQLRQENHPHHKTDSEATKEKLSYDLYYIKNRSFLLDLKIMLQTFKVLVSSKGK